MRTLIWRLALLVFCLVSVRPFVAQATSPSAAPASAAGSTYTPDPDSGMSGHVEGLFIPLVTGQPFHAKVAVTIKRVTARRH